MGPLSCILRCNIFYNRYALQSAHFCTQLHSTASYLFRARRPPLRYLQVTHGKLVTTFHSVSAKSSVFTATVRAYSILWFFHKRVVGQQLHGSHEHSKLFILQCLHIFFGVRSLIPQMTKPGNIDST